MRLGHRLLKSQTILQLQQLRKLNGFIFILCLTVNLKEKKNTKKKRSNAENKVQEHDPAK